MCKRHLTLWIIVFISALLVITLCSIAGGVYGYQSGEKTFVVFKVNAWEPIGPVNTQITGLKVLSTKNTYPLCYIVLLTTNQGQLLSSGLKVQGAAREWQWNDTSNGTSWSDFPLAALGQDQENNCHLWMKSEGKEYRVDTNGEWLLVESSPDSPFLNPPEDLTEIDQDYSKDPDWVTPPGEISQMQAVTLMWAEGSTTQVFAILKEIDGLWLLSMSRDAFEGLGIIGYTISGLVCGFIMAVLVCTIIIIFLVIYLKRKQPEKG